MTIRTSNLPKTARLLKDCRERARLFIEATPDPVYAHDLQGQILDANRAAIRIQGNTLSQLKKRRLGDIFRNLDSDALSASWKQLKSGATHIWSGHLRRNRRPAVAAEIHSLRTTLNRRPILVSVLRISPAQRHAKSTHPPSPDPELTEAFRQSESRFRMLVEQSPDAFYLHDLDGVILDVNPQSCTSLGYTREELLKLNVGDIERATPIMELRDAWRRMPPGVAHAFSGKHRRKDDTCFPIEVNNRRINDGSRSLMLALVRDTTDTERLGQLLGLILHSTARHTGTDFLDLLVRELSEAFGVCCGFVSEALDASAARVRIAAIWIDGRSGENFDYDVAGKPCADVFENGLSLIEREAYRRFPADDWLREQRIESYLAIPFYDAGGMPLGHIGIVDRKPLHKSHYQETVLRLFACRAGTEIERQRMQEAMTVRDRQLETLLQANKQLNSRLDVHEVMATLVRAAIHLSHAEAGAWGLLRDDHMVFREYYRADKIIPIDFRFAAGEGVPGHVMSTRKPYITNDAQNDPHVIDEVCTQLDFKQLINAPILDRNGKLIGCFEVHNKTGSEGFASRDVEWLQSLAADAAVALENSRLIEQIRAQHNVLEQRIAERTAELAEANADLEAFSYTVSHDLQAPLRGILGFSETLLQDHAAQLNDRGMDYLQRVQRAAVRMTDMIQALLRFSRTVHAPLMATRVNLSQLVEEILDELRDQDPDRNMDIQIEGNLEVQGDRHLLRVALVNLLHNAWKFTSQMDPARIEFGLAAREDASEYYVRDNGVGFDTQHAQRLFQPFQRMHSDEEFVGTGIGLATVRRILQRHGGNIRVESEPGRGTTFYFTLP